MSIFKLPDNAYDTRKPFKVRLNTRIAFFSVPSDQVVTLVVPCENGGYVVGVGQSIVYFDWDTDTKRTLCTVDNGKNTRMNDGKVDASGRLWFGM